MLFLRQVQVYGDRSSRQDSGAIEAGSRPALMPFGEAEKQEPAEATLPFMLKDYLELVDLTGRSIRADKRGHIAAARPRILDSLHLSDAQWRCLALEIQKKSSLTLALHSLCTCGGSPRRAWNFCFPIFPLKHSTIQPRS